MELGTNTTGRTWSAVFSPDGLYLATAGRGIKVYRIDLSSDGDAEASIVVDRSGAYMSLVFSQSSPKVSYIESWSLLHVLDLANLAAPRSLDIPVIGSVQSQSFTPDGRRILALGRTTGEVLTLDAATGERVSGFPVDDPEQPRAAGSYVNNICLSPGGRRLALASSSSLSVEIWDPVEQRLLYTLPEEQGTVWWLAWSPDGRRLAISRANGDISIWDLEEIDGVLARLELYQ